MTETPSPGVGPSKHLLGQPVPLVTFERIHPPHIVDRSGLPAARVGSGLAVRELHWRWRCRYVDGLNGQHSDWHYTVDDTGLAATYAEAFDAGLRHVHLHLSLGRRPGLLERARLQLRDLKREQRQLRLQLRNLQTTRRAARRANRKAP